MTKTNLASNKLFTGHTQGNGSVDVLIPLAKDAWADVDEDDSKKCAWVQPVQSFSVAEKRYSAKTATGVPILPVSLVGVSSATPLELIDYLLGKVTEESSVGVAAFHAIRRLRRQSGGRRLVLCRLQNDLNRPLQSLDSETPINQQIPWAGNHISLLLLPKTNEQKNEEPVPPSLKVLKLDFKKGGECSRLISIAKTAYWNRLYTRLATTFLVAAMTAYLVLNTGDMLYETKLPRSLLIASLGVVAVMLNFIVSDDDMKAQQRYALMDADRRQLFNASLLRSDDEEPSRFRVATFTFEQAMELQKLKRLYRLVALCIVFGLALLAYESWQLWTNWHLKPSSKNPLLSSSSNNSTSSPSWLGSEDPDAHHPSSLLLFLVPMIFGTVCVFAVRYARAFRSLMTNDPTWYGLYFFFLRLFNEPVEKGNTNLVGYVPLTGSYYRAGSNYQARLFVYQQRPISVTEYNMKLLPFNVNEVIEEQEMELVSVRSTHESTAGKKKKRK